MGKSVIIVCPERHLGGMSSGGLGFTDIGDKSVIGGLARRQTPKPVGMGSYVMDSHNVQRYVTTDGYVQNEGDIGVKPPRPYQIAFDALMPKRAECTNLLVPVCVSSSHIAYGSIRMEPVFMILGQSAATAAGLAMDANCPVQRVDYRNLREKLPADGQILAQ